MKNRTKKDFKVFQDECLRLQKKFGLLSYRLYFEFKHLKESNADIVVWESKCAATIRLSTKGDKTPEDCAKHEMAHLLTHRLVWLGNCRYLDSEEIYVEWERVTMILEKIL